MDRTGGMENAHDTLAPECTGPEARFPHRLGRHRTPPIRSTGTLVCTLEHDVTGRISSTRCETDGRKLTEQRRYAPTSVHVRRNPCSRSPDLVFTFTGLRSRSGRSLAWISVSSALASFRIAVLRFARWVRCSRLRTRLPVGRCLISTAVSTLLTFCAPGPPDLEVLISMSRRSIRTGSRRGVFGDREHACERGLSAVLLPAARAVEQSVGAVLSLQARAGAVSLDDEFDASRGCRSAGCLSAVALGVLHVHATELLGPVAGLFAAGSGLDPQRHVLVPVDRAPRFCAHDCTVTRAVVLPRHAQAFCSVSTSGSSACLARSVSRQSRRRLSSTAVPRRLSRGGGAFAPRCRRLRW